MPVLDLPNWLRIVFLASTLASFIPQLHRTISRKNSSGISTNYLLFNLISATEQFAFTLFYIVDCKRVDKGFHREPVTIGNWIDLAQTILVLLYWLTFSILHLQYPSSYRDVSTRSAITAYATYFFILIFPIFVDAFYSNDIDWFTHIMFAWVWHGAHILCINWIVLGLGIASFFWQARAVRAERDREEGGGLNEGDEESLSRTGLAMQAVVFTVVGVAWGSSVEMPSRWEWYHGLLGWWDGWHRYAGWVAVGYVVFASVQAGLLWELMRNCKAGDGGDDDETEPLLHA